MMKEKWNNLSQREKQFIMLGGFFSALLFIYFLIFLPIHAAEHNLRDKIKRETQQWQWMVTANQKLKELERKEPPKKTEKSILSTIQDDINQNNLLLKSLVDLRQMEDKKVQISLKNVAFDDLVKWIIQLWQVEKIEVNKMSVVETSVTGVVSAEIVFNAA